MTQLEIFRKIAPEFKQIPDDEVQGMLDLAGDILSKKRFGKMYDRAVALLAAHQFTLQTMIANDENAGAATSLTSGALVSEREGDLQRSYGGMASSSSGDDMDSLLKKTVYGLQFLALRSMCVVPVMTRMG